MDAGPGKMNENLYEILKVRFPENPDAPCLILPNGDEISYGRLEQESARYANLLASFGVQPGDRVAAQVRKSPQALFLYLGCLRAGAVYLPMNDAYQRNEIDYLLGDAANGLRGIRLHLVSKAVYARH